MDGLARDIRFAFRSLFRSRSFAVTAILALGLGTGAAAAVFSLLDGVVLRPLPFARPQQLVMLWATNRDKSLDHEPLSPVNFVDYRSLHGVFTDAAAWWRPELNLTDDANADPIRVAAVETSQNLFSLLGTRPLIGHGFAVDTGLFGHEHEVVISHRLWESRFRGDTALVGRAVRLNGYLYTVTGIMPPDFDFPAGTDVWQRLQWDLTQHSRGAHFMEGVARLRPGVALDGANRELAALGGRLASEFRATNIGWGMRAIALDREIAGVFRPALLALIGASGFLLFIACLNVANLLLARATARRREVAVRAAIGASRGRLVRQFLTESLVLALLGSLLGLVVAVAGVKGLLAWSPIAIPRASDVHVNALVLVFTTLLTAITAVVFGLVPALMMSRTRLSDALRDGARGASARERGARGLLVVSEVALAVVLLVGAGLLVRSVDRLLRAPAGVDPSSVVSADIQLPDVAYADWGRVDRFYATLLSSLRSHAEVQSAGATHFLPLVPSWRLPLVVEGAASVPAGDEPTVQFHMVDEGYFRTLHVPMLRGRDFDAHDDSSGMAVVIVNEALARQLFPDGGAIGRRLLTDVRYIGPLGYRMAIGNAHEVVGVVHDVKNNSIRNAAEPAAYFSAHQFPFREMHIVLRGPGASAQLVGLLRDDVHRLDPGLPVTDVRTMDRVLATEADPPRFIMLVLGMFALLALVLAAVGIYGILTYTVNQRRREMGIRLALGAAPGALLAMVMREGLLLAVAGCAVGAVAAFFASGALRGFLYGVAPWDPLTVLAVVGVVCAVALAACLLPGRRAAGAEPAGALRVE